MYISVENRLQTTAIKQDYFVLKKLKIEKQTALNLSVFAQNKKVQVVPGNK